ncbi:hypothetical protein EB796_023145 [Bugula neritina]|uniref:Uncharacterized protein n=1 Tax=Bugula neritina TaxID=10212 RepID=A0A7J7IX94_BUGNE|nr:hypothetical protein EB796_023145 [Bugula neritina]
MASKHIVFTNSIDTQFIVVISNIVTTPTVSAVCSTSHVHMQQTQTCHINQPLARARHTCHMPLVLYNHF